VSLVLAVEPDLRQGEILTRIVRHKVRADLVLVESRDAALTALAGRTPDVVLLTALLSPRDEDELLAHLRRMPASGHIQTHTIPQLASDAVKDQEATGRGLLGKLRKKKKASAAPMTGCDPALFASELRSYIARAEELKAEAAALAARADAAMAADDGLLEQVTGGVVIEPSTPASVVSEAASAWSSPFEWRRSEPLHRPEPDAWASPPDEPTPTGQDDSREAAEEALRAIQAEAEARAAAEEAAAERERQRLEAEAAAERERQRLEAEAAAEREHQRLEAEAAAERERQRLEAEAAAERERLRLEAEAAAERERLRLEARAAAERERQRLQARAAAERERHRLEAAERERHRLEAAERERQRREAEAAAARERLRREVEAAAAERERQRLQAEAAAERERQRLEAEAAAQRERQRLEAEAAAERERQRLEAEAAAARERQRLEAEAAAERERQRLEAEAAAERERQRLEAEAAAERERQRLEAEAAAERERQRLEAEAAAERERERIEAEAAAERERIHLEEELQRAAAALEASQLEEDAEGEIEINLDAGIDEPIELDDPFAAFREGHDEQVAGILNRIPVTAWARVETPAAPAAPGVEFADDCGELLSRLMLPADVAGVRYANGCRIRRVRVPPTGKAPAKTKGPVILSRRALNELRQG
jgi:hypothetical protein